MLSRLGFAVGRLTPAVRGASVRLVSTSASLANQQAVKPAVSEQQGFLYDKTGATGMWTLGLGLTALAISKEYYIINSELIIAVAELGVFYYLIKKVGPDISKYFDDRSAEILARFNEGKFAKIDNLKEAIASHKGLEDMLESRHEVFEVLKEKNEMGLEEEYRRRLHEVNREVKKRLDYQVEVEKVTRQFEQEQLIQWLEKAVIDSVKGQEDQSMAQCMTDLKAMAAA